MDPYWNGALSRYHESMPIVLVDVGSSGGLKKNWVETLMHLRIIGFEPDDREYERLKRITTSSNITYLNIALSDQQGESDFYLTSKQQVSSMYKPDRDFLDQFIDRERFDITKTVRIRTDTLDNQLRIAGIDDVDFIKLDAQGAELMILRGAVETIRSSVFGLEIEVEFAAMYEGQPLFSDIDRHVRDLGYQLFDLRPCYFRRRDGEGVVQTKGQIVFADAIYFRSIDNISAIVSGRPEGCTQKAKILKIISICRLYGHADYALSIYREYQGMFSTQEQQCVERALTGHRSILSAMSGRTSNSKARRKAADWVYRFWQFLQPKYWKSVIYLDDGQRIEKGAS